jgi:RNA polymerase sigma-70 factor (ECF subfamily)
MQPGVDEERVWVRAAAEGDRAAFERLYHRHAGRIYAVCLRLCGEPGRAEECAQDAFVQAWQRLGQFRGDSAFGTWLYRIAVNTALSAGRAHGLRVRHVTTTGDLAAHERPAHHPPPGARLDLEAAIQALPAGARRVFVLHDVEGHKHEEIATLLGIAPGTSKAHLHHARRMLREALTP